MRMIAPLIFLLACGQGLSPSDYRSWVEDPAHGLRVRSEDGPWRLQVQLRPAPYEALLSAGEDALTADALAQAEAATGQTFSLQVRRRDATSAWDTPGAMDGSIAARLQEAVTLETGSDSLPCRLAVLEPIAGMTPYLSFWLAFDQGAAAREGQDLTLVLSGSPFGSARILIRGEDVAALPPIAL